MNLSLSVVQLYPILGDKAKNLELIHNYIKTIDSDIIVFPELATSGYYFQSRQESEKYADEFHGDVMNSFAEEAEKLSKVIVIGFPEKSGDKIFNSAAVLFPDKKLNKVYRKTHLFFKEVNCFDPGDSGYFVIDYKEKDVKIGTMICYDWRFPEAARTLALLGADLIVCPANLITNAWHGVMPTRAFENKVYLAVANRIGTETRNNEEVFFKGESALYDYEGQILAKAGIYDETVISSVINPEQTRDKSFNEYNDIFKDRRSQYYKL